MVFPNSLPRNVVPAARLAQVRSDVASSKLPTEVGELLIEYYPSIQFLPARDCQSRSPLSALSQTNAKSCCLHQILPLRRSARLLFIVSTGKYLSVPLI